MAEAPPHARLVFEWFPELQGAMASCANAAIAGNISPKARLAEQHSPI